HIEADCQCDGRGHDHDGRNCAVSAEAQSGFVAEDARGQRQQRDDDAYGDRTHECAVVALRHDKGPEGDDPGAHAVKLEAMRAVSKAVAVRGAIAQTRPDTEEVSVRRPRFAWREPEAHADHGEGTSARDIKRRAPAGTVRNEL